MKNFLTTPIKQLWNTFINNVFIQDEPVNTFVLPEWLSEPRKSCRKPSDTTKLTQGMYDFVIEMKAEQNLSNVLHQRNPIKHSYETTEELCDYLNMVFGTTFSRSKLTRIWTGKVKREDLPVGITYTISF